MIIKFMNNRIHLALVVVLLSILFSCRREFERPILENEILTPILTTKLTINEIVPDSLRNTYESGLVSLVYRNSLYSAALSSFQELETREFNQTAKLQSLALSPRSAIRSISLGQVAEAEGGVIGQLIINSNGNTSPIPPLANLSYGPLAVDGSAFFETVTLDSGYMDVTIENQFPSDLSNINFEIRNENDNSLVGSEVFTLVPANDIQTKSIDLAGKTVDGDLLGNILNFNVDGTGGSAVLIDTSDQIIVTITVRDMKVNSATAIFPAQDVISLQDTNAMENVGDLKLTKATAKTGFVTVRVVSTVEDTMFFNYFIPEGKKNGVPFEINQKINPAPPNGSTSKEFNFPVDGYTFDLTGFPIINHYNAFYSELTGRIDSTGRLVNLSLDDSLLVYVKLSQFKPEYVEGYLGSNSISIGPEAVNLDLFKNFKDGTIDFEEVKISIGVSNGNGVPFSVALNSLEAINTTTNEQVDINLTGIDNPLTIQEAVSLFEPWESSWQLDETSGNLNDALNIFPNRLLVALDVTSNPAEDSLNLTQFAVDSNKLEAYADIEVPLSFIADGLRLVDTSSFDPRSIKKPDGILDGVFYLTAENTFPVSASIEMLFIDQNGNILETATFDEQLQVGTRNRASISKLEWAFSRDQLNRLLTSSSIVFSIEANTESLTSYSKIYSDQSINLTLSSRFNYLFDNE